MGNPGMSPRCPLTTTKRYIGRVASSFRQHQITPRPPRSALKYRAVPMSTVIRKNNVSVAGTTLLAGDARTPALARHFSIPTCLLSYKIDLTLPTPCLHTCHQVVVVAVLMKLTTCRRHRLPWPRFSRHPYFYLFFFFVFSPP